MLILQYKQGMTIETCSGTNLDIGMIIGNGTGDNHTLAFIDMTVGSECYGDVISYTENWMNNGTSVQGGVLDTNRMVLALTEVDGSNNRRIREYDFSTVASRTTAGQTPIASTNSFGGNWIGDLAFDRVKQDRYYMGNANGSVYNLFLPIGGSGAPTSTIASGLNIGFGRSGLTFDASIEALWVKRATGSNGYQLDVSSGNEGNILQEIAFYWGGASGYDNFGTMANGDIVTSLTRDSGYLIRQDVSTGPHPNLAENGWDESYALNSSGNGFRSHFANETGSTITDVYFIGGWHLTSSPV